MKNLLAKCLLLAILAGCGDESGADPEAEAKPEPQPPAAESVNTTASPPPGSAIPDNPSAGDLLPAPFEVVWEPWHGDFEEMVDRRLVRVVVPFGGYQYYYKNGRPKGAVYELVQRFETYINDELGRRNVRVYVVSIPISRDQLIPALIEGHADIIAGDLTSTEFREVMFDFSRPVLKDVEEVVITNKAATGIDELDDLSGKEIVVRRSSSYFEHLRELSTDMKSRDIDPPAVTAADELLEAEDLLEMLNAGIIDLTVLDKYKAEFWAEVFPNIVIRDDLVIHSGGTIGWGVRKESPELLAVVNGFLRKFGRGTLVGNDTYNRYLEDSTGIRCINSQRDNERIANLARLFQKYGKKYHHDWLALGAQALQESGLRQNRKSPAGAVGIMQIKPSTASDRNVGIDDVTNLENNIHAGAKYMRFLIDRYFSDGDINTLNQWLFGLAAYNAGPARIARLRNEAQRNGYDRNLWFDNVEIIAARKIGRETVTYVSNIFKYYVGYQLGMQRASLEAERFGSILSDCAAGPD